VTATAVGSYYNWQSFERVLDANYSSTERQPETDVVTVNHLWKLYIFIVMDLGIESSMSA